MPVDMRQTIDEFIRYGAASLLTYAWIFGGTYVFTELVGIAANWSYLLVMTAAYVMTYLVNVLYVFKNQLSPKTLRRFIVHACLFWSLNNVFYSALYYFTSIHYMLLVVINIAVFTVLRFLSMKWLVFGRGQAQVNA